MEVISNRTLNVIRAMPCIWCGQKGPSDAHHLRSKGSGRLDVPINLAALCRWDHSRHHSGKEPSYQQLIERVARREKTTAEAIEEAVNYIRDILDKDGEPKRPQELSEKAAKLIVPYATAQVRRSLRVK